jgi:hypothetical protein
LAFPVPRRIDTLLSGDRPATRFVQFAVALPERPNGMDAWVALIAGIPAQGRIPIPGFLNPLGITPVIVLGVVQVAPAVGTAQFAVQYPQLPPGTRLDWQAVLLWFVAANMFSNNFQSWTPLR